MLLTTHDSRNFTVPVKFWQWSSLDCIAFSVLVKFYPFSIEKKHNYNSEKIVNFDPTDCSNPSDKLLGSYPFQNICFSYLS